MEMPAVTNLAGLTVSVRIAKELRVRVWLGVWLIRLATRVMGCGIEIEVN